MSNGLTPARIAFLYASFSALWIVLTSYLLTYLANDPLTQSVLEISKGLAFVSLTSGLLYLLLKKCGLSLLAEQEKSDQLMRQFFDLPFVGMAVTSLATKRWIQFNDYLCTMLGYSRDELIKKTWADMTHPEDLAANLVEFERVIRRESEGFVINKRFIRKDGTVMFATIDVKCVRQPDAAADYLITTIQDITARKQGEQALQESESDYRSLVDNMLNGIAHCRMIFKDKIPIDYEFIKVNPSYTKITGLKDVVGRKVSEVIPGYCRDNPESLEVFGRVAHTGEPTRWEHYLSALDKWFSFAIYSPAPDEFVVAIDNITERKQAEQRILSLANFDLLTGLPNRIMFAERFNFALSFAQRNNKKLALIYIDLDHFKNVNEALGQSVGDKLLIEIARRLKSTVRDEDTISRQGGDEFVLVLLDADVDVATHMAEKLLLAIAQRCRIDQHELVVTSSIGIAMYPGDGADFEILSKCADTAMYRAKADGRNNHRFFTPKMQARSTRILQLENSLRRALERDELFLLYQPQVLLQDGHIIGAEALLRWQHPELGLISPSEFIPIAESSGQILQIGEWVLRTAIGQLKSWMDGGMAPMVMAVNLSAVQFRYASLPELVTRILDEVQLSPHHLELELTEGVAMDDPLAAIAMMENLHTRGIRMSIDDFGTGYSSLNYLKKFKVYKLKIDQSFVRDITENPEDKAIVSAIINMASSLGMQTIAEGVETAEQLAFLRLQGCDEVQGYYFSKPLSAGQFAAYVRGDA